MTMTHPKSTHTEERHTEEEKDCMTMKDILYTASQEENEPRRLSIYKRRIKKKGIRKVAVPGTVHISQEIETDINPKNKKNETKENSRLGISYDEKKKSSK